MKKPLSLWSVIRNYKFQSVFFKNFIMFLLLIQLPIVGLSIGIYKLYSKTVTEEISTVHLTSLSRVRDMVDMILRDVDAFSLRIASDQLLTDMLEKDMTYPPDYTSSVDMELLFRKLKLTEISRNFVHSVYLYSERNQLLVSSSTGLWPMYQFADHGWLETFNEKKTAYKEWPFPRKIKLYPTDEQGLQLLTLIRTAPLLYSSKTGGIIINIDTERFGRTINNVSNHYIDNIFILDASGTVLYNNNFNLINQPISAILPDANIVSSQPNEPTFIYNNQLKESVSFVNSQYNNWKFISVVPLRLYEEKASYIRHFLLISSLCSIVVSLLLALFLSWKMFRPIKQIMAVVTQPEDWQESSPGHKKVQLDEIKYITANVLSAYGEKQELQKELTDRLTLLNKAYAVALQSQINPHFMYNTLESLNWQALRLTGGENQVSEMIVSLSKLLRFSLEGEDNLVPLRAEIENCKHYIDIQMFRYPRKFEVEWQIDNQIDACKIPRLTLQPLLENAIYHGIKPQQGPGKISITGSLEGETVSLQVVDDGMGIDAEQVTKINKELKEKYNLVSQHIGIKNVNQRIKLIFGEQYGLHVASSQGEGTEISITLPAHTKIQSE
ncbi:cache domain-containing sensor histidine kinase [Paenibacillus eucommiae]|uniref:Two-component system sensor histidine kinase YesM n=1 Tax=Paenibacillus eucommiae TaxID=1355755 RepID=A0ABS4IUI1_9BACL|nr:sensor histidine kinase [Paenibacillus eucommiae]MBP1990745.1 two-component system sensor histidine kinase YesM [Paenibacillus eucommiae]